MAQAKTLTPTELRRVLDYVASRKHAARNRCLVLITHLAGMRVGEVAALTYAHVLNADGSVRDQIPLSANETKGRNPRAVFVSPRLRKEIAAYLAAVPANNPNAALFYTQKCPERGFTANTLTQFFLTLYARAGIEGASSHSGRRSFATALAAKGTGIRVLMRLMGHRNIAVTATYIDANDDMLRNAVALL